MHERIKEHVRDIRLARTQTSMVSKHANKTITYTGTRKGVKRPSAKDFIVIKLIKKWNPNS